MIHLLNHIIFLDVKSTYRPSCLYFRPILPRFYGPVLGPQSDYRNWGWRFKAFGLTNNSGNYSNYRATDLRTILFLTHEMTLIVDYAKLFSHSKHTHGIILSSVDARSSSQEEVCWRLKKVLFFLSLNMTSYFQLSLDTIYWSALSGLLCNLQDKVIFNPAHNQHYFKVRFINQPSI